MSGARKVHIKSFGCQMNVYNSHRMADTLAREGYAETATPDDADLIILNTCHIREKAADKVYSELGRLRQLKQAAAQDGRRVVVAVAGCVAQAEGAEIIRRAPAVDLVVGPQSYQHLPELLGRVGRGERGGRHRVSGRGQVRQPAGAEPASHAGARHLGLRHRPGRLRQVLHVLRRALYARRRAVAAGRQDRRRGRAAGRRRRARGHADRAERQCVSRRGAGRRAVAARPAPARGGASARHRAPALHHQPSGRHGGQPDRGPSRSRRPDAAPASAGAIGLGPHPRGHEPPAHARRLSGRHRAVARGAARYGVLVGLHRRLPGRDRGGFRRHPRADRRGGLRRRLFVQVFGAARDAGGRHGGAGAGRREA